MQEALTFASDLIILAIGENVPALKAPEEKSRFQSSVTQLLTFLKADRHPTILVRSSFWANPAKDEALQQAWDVTHYGSAGASFPIDSVGHAARLSSASAISSAVTGCR